MGTLGHDLRFALRQCRRQPGFTLAVVSTLALTIGANAAVFAVADAVVFRALPLADPDRLVWVTSVRPDNPEGPFTLPEYVDYRAQTRTLAGLAAYANWSANMAGDGVTERFQGARVSANLFDVLGLSPAAGRLLREADDSLEAPRVTVVSHRLWRRQFGGAPDVIGRHVRINGESYEIVGILPPHFPLPLRDIDVVTPLVPDRDPLRHVRNSVNFLRLVGRLNSGVTSGQAQEELTAICAALRRQFPKEYARKISVRTRSLQDALIGDHRQALLFLLASVAVVLAVALGNLLSLMLVRANGRRAEMSIRIAIGASRRQLVQQLSIEALPLTAAGGAIGCLTGVWASEFAILWAPSSIPRLGEVGFDGTTFLFAAGLTLSATLLLSLAPIGTVVRTRARDALHPGSRGAVGDRWNQRVRNAVVVGEISAALVLLLATALIVQSLLRLQAVPPGFNPDGVFQARVSLPPSYRSPEQLTRFYTELSGRLAAWPGVRAVGLISAAPLSGLLATVPFSVTGQPHRSERESPNANLRIISPGYLAVAGTRILKGRPFSERDDANAPPVALVSEAFADRFLGDAAIGQELRIDDNNTGPRPVTIVGIVENVRQTALDGPPAIDIYIPLPQLHPDGTPLLRNNQFWMIKTATEPAAVRTPFLSHLRSVDRDAAISSAGTMDQFLDAWLAPRRFSLGLFAAFSLTAVLLAVSGLYGLVSYSVSQRRREIGVRMAIGATGRDVHRLILDQAARLALAGAALGLGVAIVARPVGVRLGQDASLDPWVMAATAALLCAVVVAAGWMPARRAARVEPSLALKGD